MSPLLEYFLVAFILVLIIVTIVLTVYLVKFLKETTKTMVDIQGLTQTIETEIAPAMKSLTNILSNVNNISNATNKQFEIAKKILTTILGASCMAFANAKNNSFINGILSGFNIFSKKRR